MSIFGKFNSIVSFETDDRIDSVIDKACRIFHANETVFSMLDLNTFEMIDYDLTKFEVGNVIGKVILENGRDKIIIEFYKKRFIIEHIFWYNHLNEVPNGILLMHTFFHLYVNAILVLGFEISVNIDSFNESLKELLVDVSTHPIIVVKSGVFKKDIFTSDENAIAIQKIELIEGYYKILIDGKLFL